MYACVACFCPSVHHFIDASTLSSLLFNFPFNFSLVVCVSLIATFTIMVSNCILYNLTKQFQFLILLLFVLAFLLGDIVLCP